jgi:hypothetical protein
MPRQRPAYPPIPLPDHPPARSPAPTAPLSAPPPSRPSLTSSLTMPSPSPHSHHSNRSLLLASDLQDLLARVREKVQASKMSSFDCSTLEPHSVSIVGELESRLYLKLRHISCTFGVAGLFGLWSKVFHGNVGIRRALKAFSRMLAVRVGISTKFPSLLLQCRQFRTRGWG